MRKHAKAGWYRLLQALTRMEEQHRRAKRMQMGHRVTARLGKSDSQLSGIRQRNDWQRVAPQKIRRLFRNQRHSDIVAIPQRGVYQHAGRRPIIPAPPEPEHIGVDRETAQLAFAKHRQDIVQLRRIAHNVFAILVARQKTGIATRLRFRAFARLRFRIRFMGKIERCDAEHLNEGGAPKASFGQPRFRRIFQQLARFYLIRRVFPRAGKEREQMRLRIACQDVKGAVENAGGKRLPQNLHGFHEFGCCRLSAQIAQRHFHGRAANHIRLLQNQGQQLVIHAGGACRYGEARRLPVSQLAFAPIAPVPRSITHFPPIRQRDDEVVPHNARRIQRERRGVTQRAIRRRLFGDRHAIAALSRAINPGAKRHLRSRRIPYVQP